MDKNSHGPLLNPMMVVIGRMAYMLCWCPLANLFPSVMDWAFNWIAVNLLFCWFKYYWIAVKVLVVVDRINSC